VCSSLGSYFGTLELEKSVLYPNVCFKKIQGDANIYTMFEPPVKFRYLNYISVYSIRAKLSEIIMFIVGNFPKTFELFFESCM